MNKSSPPLGIRAETLLKSLPHDAAEIPADDVRRLLHEVQVQQIELEIQNEELRRTQVELARTRDRYSDLYDYAPVGYLTLDVTGVIEESNLAAAKMLNVERQQLSGRKFSEFVDPASQDAWHVHRREVLKCSHTLGCELRMTVDEQSSRTFRIQSVAVFDPHGEASHCRTALLDVSERRIAYDALETLNIDLHHNLGDSAEKLDRSIEQLRLLSEAVSHLGEGVMITGDDLDWPGPDIVFVNPAMCRISGYTAEELLGKSPRILQGEGTDPRSLEKIRNDLRIYGTSVAELVNYRKDGTRYDVELFITPLFDATGKRTNFVSIQRDVTERRAIGEALRHEHELSSKVIKTSQNAILVLTPQGEINLFNPYLEMITGFRFEEVRGRDWFTHFLPEAERGMTRELFSKALVGNLNRGHVSPIVTKDGSLRYIEWYNAPLTAADGRLIGLLCNGQDVTEQRELERHILDIAREEQGRIGNDLHDGVGQELTGLSMIAETLAIALSQESPAEFQIAEKIRLGLQRSLAQVRALSRGLNPVNVDSAGLMSSLAEMTEGLNQIYGVLCDFQCEQSVLLSDNETATHLYRIAQEATTNAIRHGHPKRITIQLMNTDDVVVLSITDDGDGIDLSQSPRGMGLRTMHYRAKLINAQLSISPAAGGGTEVVCTLPL